MSTVPRFRAGGAQLRAIVAAIFVSVTGPLPAMMVGALAPQMSAELGVSVASLGTTLAGYFVVSASVSAYAGRRLESTGWQSGLWVAALGAAVWLGGMAILARSWWALGLLLVGAGVTNAVAHPTANQSLATTSMRRIGVLFGMKQSAIPMASLLAGISVPLLAVHLGWRVTMGVAAGFIVLLAIAMAAAVDIPRRRHAQPTRQYRLEREDYRSLWMLSLATGAATAATYASSAFFVTYAVSLSIPEGEAGTLLAVGSLTAIIVRVAAGWLADRYGKMNFLTPAIMVLVGTVALGITAVSPPETLVVVVVLLFASLWGWTGLFNAAVVQAYPHVAATTTSITQTGVYMGAAGGPLLFGLVAELGSFSMAWAVLIPLGLVGSTLMLVSHRHIGNIHE